MTTPTPPPRRNFTLYFILFMLGVTAVVFISFTYVARQSKMQRSEISRSNLLAMHAALRTFSEAPQNAGKFPDELNQLVPQYLSPDVFFHPAWPDRSGYVYVSGVRATGKDADPPSDTIVIFENIPPGKEKLGRQALFLNGEVHMWNEAEFQSRISAQESAWKSQGRAWRALPAEPPSTLK